MSNDAHLQLVNGPSSTEQVSFNENHSDFPLDVNILRQLQQLHLQTSNLNQPSQHASQAQLSQFHSRYSGMSGSGSGLGGSPGFAPVSEGAADFTSTATTDPMLHEFWSEQARRDQASVTPSRSAPNLSALASAIDGNPYGAMFNNFSASTGGAVSSHPGSFSNSHFAAAQQSHASYPMSNTALGLPPLSSSVTAPPGYINGPASSRPMRRIFSMPSMTMTCPNAHLGCGWHGPPERQAAHVAECPAPILSCRYAKFGCAVRCSRVDMATHVESSVALHLALAESKVDELTAYLACNTGGDPRRKRDVEVIDLKDDDLILLLTRILVEHGKASVGKLGSLLHSYTNNHSLSAACKEKYGGLKKFLESHPHIFVIGPDHPFNPTVWLSTTLQPQLLQLLQSQSTALPALSSLSVGAVASAVASGAPAATTTTTPTSYGARPLPPQPYHQPHQQHQQHHLQHAYASTGSPLTGSLYATSTGNASPPLPYHQHQQQQQQQQQQHQQQQQQQRGSGFSPSFSPSFSGSPSGHPPGEWLSGGGGEVYHTSSLGQTLSPALGQGQGQGQGQSMGQGAMGQGQTQSPAGYGSYGSYGGGYGLTTSTSGTSTSAGRSPPGFLERTLSAGRLVAASSASSSSAVSSASSASASSSSPSSSASSSSGVSPQTTGSSDSSGGL